MAIGYGAILPAEVVVSYPAMLRGSGGCGDPTKYEVVVTIAEALSDYGSSPSSPPFASHPGQKRYTSTAVAVFDDPIDPPINEDQLRRLAWRIARDFYSWRTAYRDVTYPGTVAYEPDGTADLIRWTYSQGLVETRVTSPPFDCEPEELLHGIPCLDELSSSDPSSEGSCPTPRRLDSGRGDRFVWIKAPDGIPAAERSGRSVDPGVDEAEVFEEDEDGKLCPTGIYRLIHNYWSNPVRPESLGIARCRRGRLIVEQEDCSPEDDSSGGD